MNARTASEVLSQTDGKLRQLEISCIAIPSDPPVLD